MDSGRHGEINIGTGYNDSETECLQDAHREYLHKYIENKHNCQ